MSKKQYIDRPFDRSINFERIIDLYEDGVLQNFLKFMM